MTALWYLDCVSKLLPATLGRTVMKPQAPSTRVLVLLLCVAAAPDVHAQVDGRRFEVGGQIATLRLSDSDSETNAGFGGRVSYDIWPWLTAEGEMNFFENDTLERHFAGSIFPEHRLGYSRRRIEGFFGPKVGLRTDRFGVFGKVRPGFARLFNKGMSCVGEPCTRMLPAPLQYRTEFALDVGGVVEFYPTARTVTRVDLDSIMIRHRSMAPPCRDCTSRNFASRVGVGFRF